MTDESMPEDGAIMNALEHDEPIMTAASFSDPNFKASFTSAPNMGYSASTTQAVDGYRALPRVANLNPTTKWEPEEGRRRMTRTADFGQIQHTKPVLEPLAPTLDHGVEKDSGQKVKE